MYGSVHETEILCFGDRAGYLSLVSAGYSADIAAGLNNRHGVMYNVNSEKTA